jgi:aminopeptidase S
MRRLIVAAVAAATLVGCTAPAPTPEPSPPVYPLQRQLEAAVSGASAVRHLRELQRIADVNGGNRASPGPGYDASVDYVAGVLRGAGWQVSTPLVELEDGARIRNVIAQTRTGGPDHVVMAGAHLDSVSEGAGINDNGSGVAALLEIAGRMGGSPGVVNQVRLALWGAEEVDMDGSTQYVEELSSGDRDRIALYLNLDMVASPNAGYFVEGGVGRGDDAGPAGSNEVARVLAGRLTATGIRPERIEFRWDSDYVPFLEADIPAGAAFTGDEEEKTPEEAARWGGRVGVDYDPCYHEACDRLDNIDSTALDRYTDAVAGTIAHFAMSISELPSQ